MTRVLTTDRLIRAITAKLEERRAHTDGLNDLRSVGIVVRPDRSGSVIVSVREDVEYRDAGSPC